MLHVSEVWVKDEELGYCIADILTQRDIDHLSIRDKNKVNELENILEKEIVKNTTKNNNNNNSSNKKKSIKKSIHSHNIHHLVGQIQQDEIYILRKQNHAKELMCLLGKECNIVDETHLDNMVTDIAKINNLSEGPLYTILKRRFLKDEIYTDVNKVLISFNPCKHIPGLYDFPIDFSQDPQISNLEKIDNYLEMNSKNPHAYIIAARCFKDMHDNKRNQSVIVSGESGAGKTEASKKVIAFLTRISSNINNVDNDNNDNVVINNNNNNNNTNTNTNTNTDNRSRTESGNTHSSIEDKIRDCCPLLEAFGNATTLFNPNSSRFGRFIKILYKGDKIIGAKIDHYLLEKSRIVHGLEGERNYHIFYQLCRGIINDDRYEKFQLQTPEKYKYLNQSSKTYVDGINDYEEFQRIKTVLSILEVTEEEQMCLFGTLAGILHLGNIKFQQDDRGLSRICEESVNDLKIASELLGMWELSTALIGRTVSAKSRASVYKVDLTVNESYLQCDALAKFIYDSVFTWIINKCNKILEKGDNNNNNNDNNNTTTTTTTTTSISSNTTSFIGILDIFGFEVFQINSFEQLCINYCNEKLQNIFNSSMIGNEIEFYHQNGIDTSFLIFENNDLCVDLLELSPTGILRILDEACMLARSGTDNDKKFLDKILSVHKGKNHYFGYNFKRDEFSIKHFAKEVYYDYHNFIDKNADKIMNDLLSLCETADNNILKSKFTHNNTMDTSSFATKKRNTRSRGGAAMNKTNEKKKDITVAQKFSKQLNDLNKELMSTETNYIRCIKPNENLIPLQLDHETAMRQLRSSGVMGYVAIRTKGYPIRLSWEEAWALFLQNNYHVAAEVPPSAKPEIGVRTVLEKIGSTDKWQVSKYNKLFLKVNFMQSMEANKMNISAILIQKIVRGKLQRKKYYAMKRLGLMLKMFVIANHLRRKHRQQERAIITIQCCFRNFQLKKKLMCRRKEKAQKLFKHLQAGISLNKALQRYIVRRKAKRFKAAMQIQMAWRQTSSYKLVSKMLHQKRVEKLILASSIRIYLVLKRAVRRSNKAATIIQKRIKGFVARQAYIRYQSATKLQSTWKGFIYRNKDLRNKTCSRLQRYYRIYSCRKKFKLIVLSVIKVQQFIIKRVLMRRARKSFLREKRMILIVQRSLKTRKNKRAFRNILEIHRKLKGGTMIKKFILGRYRNYILAIWLEETFWAASSGDTKCLKLLLANKSSKYIVGMKSCKNIEHIRNRYHDFSSILHHAVQSRKVFSVKEILSKGVNVEIVDSEGLTPLHKAAVIGDNNLDIIMDLVSNAINKKTYVNTKTKENETAYDLLDEHDSDYKKTIQFLQSITSGQNLDKVLSTHSKNLSITAVIKDQLSETQMTEDKDMIDFANDPYYQLLVIKENERQSKEKAIANKKNSSKVLLGIDTTILVNKNNVNVEDNNHIIEQKKMLLKQLQPETNIFTKRSCRNEELAKFRLGKRNISNNTAAIKINDDISDYDQKKDDDDYKMQYDDIFDATDNNKREDESVLLFQENSIHRLSIDRKNDNTMNEVILTGSSASLSNIDEENENENENKKSVTYKPQAQTIKTAKSSLKDSSSSTSKQNKRLSFNFNFKDVFVSPTSPPKRRRGFKTKETEPTEMNVVDKKEQKKKSVRLENDKKEAMKQKLALENVFKSIDELNWPTDMDKEIITDNITKKQNDDMINTFFPILFGIQNNNTDEDQKGWYYFDTENQEQGPFPSEWMNDWISEGLLQMNLKVRYGNGKVITELKNIIDEDNKIIDKDTSFKDIKNAIEILLKSTFEAK